LVLHHLLKIKYESSPRPIRNGDQSIFAAKTYCVNFNMVLRLLKIIEKKIDGGGDGGGGGGGGGGHLKFASAFMRWKRIFLHIGIISTFCRYRDNDNGISVCFCLFKFAILGDRALINK